MSKLLQCAQCGSTKHQAIEWYKKAAIQECEDANDKVEELLVESNKETVKCSHCGRLNEKGDKICIHCGKKIKRGLFR